MAASRERSAAARLRDGPAALHSRGAVGGETFAIDASLIKADANRQKGIDGEKDCHQKRPAGPSKNLWLCSTMRPSALRPMWCQVRLTGRSGGALDRRPRRAGLLRLFHQLSDRCRERDHCGCRGNHRDPAGRGPGRKTHGRTLDRSLRSLFRRLLGDSAYGSAEMLGWLVYEHGIEPHVTVFDKSTRQRTEWCARRVPSRSNRPKPRKLAKLIRCQALTQPETHQRIPIRVL